MSFLDGEDQTWNLTANLSYAPWGDLDPPVCPSSLGGFAWKMRSKVAMDKPILPRPPHPEIIRIFFIFSSRKFSLPLGGVWVIPGPFTSDHIFPDFHQPGSEQAATAGLWRAGASASCSSPASGFFSPPGHTEDACGLGTWAGLCLVWQVGKEVLTQRPLLLAAPPLPTAASSQRLCPSPVFFSPASSASSC